MYNKTSLVLRYEFNDPATFTTDATGNGNTLTDFNTVASTNDPTRRTVLIYNHASRKYLDQNGNATTSRTSTNAHYAIAYD